jgi:glycosyltransferase involved in cell wall biosynthesis
VSRLPVSVIVTASGSPNDFYTCLESLRPTLGLRDEVVCVVPADRIDLRSTLPRGNWLTVVEDDSGDQAHRWTTGLDATSHSTVVFLDGDVCVSAHWLEPLAEALSDPDVVAAGPRCHRSFGPQAADPSGEAMVRAAAFKAYARQWRQEHSGRFSDVDQLGPVCAAFRREALSEAGGPTADFPYEQLRALGRIVVAHAALLTHVGSDLCALHLPDVPADAPLVSASMIVKDEEDILAECLSALRDFVDEIVVYDTGSTDRTRDIAREHGARVIEGHWNDSFGDARNRALAHCTGQWILYVDADEVISGDPAALRAHLLTAATPSLLLGVESLVGHGTGKYGRQLYPRLFRRNRGRFIRRLHEQVVDRVIGLTLASPAVVDCAVLHHSGYTVVRSSIKDKGARNLRLAELSTGDDDEDRYAAVLGLARSQLLAARHAEAVDTCLQALADGENPYHRNFYWVLISSYEQLGKLTEASAAIAELRKVCNSPVTADELEARIRFRQGDHAGALAITEAFPDHAVDDDAIVVDRGRVIGVEILCLYELERYHEAAERLRACIRSETLPVSIPQTVAILSSDGGGIAEFVDLLPQSAIRTLLLVANDAPDSLLDDLLEALWQRHGALPTILASAAHVGVRLPLMRAMEWSARLRQHGFAAHCTLLALAAARRTPRDRVLAAAIALELFSDDRARPLLAEALGALPAPESASVLAELRMLAPSVAAGIQPAHIA